MDFYDPSWIKINYNVPKEEVQKPKEEVQKQKMILQVDGLKGIFVN